MKRLSLVLLLVLSLGVLLIASTQTQAGPLPGAIFTTLEDGSRVNANIYQAKEDVYLDGGPGLNAPSGAAGLPAGDYYFQVTDPSGKILLSTDPVKCRRFTVSADGVIVAVVPAACLKKVHGNWVLVPCQHQTGIDQDHSELGAITVQLMPFDNTPNNGGVYKVWVTPVEQFVGDPNLVDSGYSPGNYHGFIPAWSKTDNFKVKGKPCPPPLVTVEKLSGWNWATATLVTGWAVDVIDPLAVINTVYTPATVTAIPAGIWTFTEQVPPHWLPMGAMVDGVPVVPWTSVTVPVSGICGETHSVRFLNLHLGRLVICKRYLTESGPPIAGWKFCLQGTSVTGATIGPMCVFTGADGCAVLDDFMPGTYTICEVLPTGWHLVGEGCREVTLEEGGEISLTFVNYCTGQAQMHTKGFWQNQGCSIITAADRTYVNGLAPYSSGSVSTTGQDNCGGVHCPDTTLLPFDNNSEIGCFIVAPNSQPSYPNIGLAQQLLAFILNCRHWVPSMDSTIVTPWGPMTAQAIIDAAIAAWSSGDPGQVSLWQNRLTTLNEAGSVEYISAVPCPVVYP